MLRGPSFYVLLGTIGSTTATALKDISKVIQFFLFSSFPADMRSMTIVLLNYKDMELEASHPCIENVVNAVCSTCSDSEQQAVVSHVISGNVVFKS